MEKITLGIEGMMCPMCEAHMNDAIRKAFDTTKVKSSRHKKQTVFYVPRHGQSRYRKNPTKL